MLIFFKLVNFVPAVLEVSWYYLKSRLLSGTAALPLELG